MPPYEQVGNEAGRGGTVASPAAIASTVAAAAPTKAEFDALRADVVNLHGTVTALVAALRTSNTID